MTGLGSVFSSLRVPNYRRYFAGQTISVTGTWIQKTAQAWLVLQLTDSATWLGVTAALQQMPTLLLGAWGGLLADRFNKRRLMVCTQTAAAVPALLLGVMVLSGNTSVWLVAGLALMLGVIDALDKPARHSFVRELVGSENVTNAVSLNNVVINTGKVIGPGLAGVLIASLGLAGAFLTNAVSYAAVVVSLLLMRSAELNPAPRVAKGPGQLREGWLYVWRTPALLGPLALLTVTGMMAYEWSVTLPIMAQDAFGGDAQTFGLMFSAMGVGAIVGGLLTAGLVAATSAALLVTAWVFGVLMLGAATAPTLLVFLVLMAFVGAASIAFRGTAMSLMQVRADPAMAGRVISLVIIAIGGTTPIGGPLIGWIGDVYGARVAMGLGGISTILAACVLALVLWRHRNRQHKAAEAAALAAI